MLLLNSSANRSDFFNTHSLLTTTERPPWRNEACVQPFRRVGCPDENVGCGVVSFIRFWVYARARSDFDPATGTGAFIGIPRRSPLGLRAKRSLKPLLGSIQTSAIRSRIGVSRWYAGRIRQGYIPHPRHWRALAQLVGISEWG